MNVAVVEVYLIQLPQVLCVLWISCILLNCSNDDEWDDEAMDPYSISSWNRLDPRKNQPGECHMHIFYIFHLI